MLNDKHHLHKCLLSVKIIIILMVQFYFISIVWNDAIFFFNIFIIFFALSNIIICVINYYDNIEVIAL